MKLILLYKIILLGLPVITLIYIFIIRDRLGIRGGAGGGSYDFTRAYSLIAVGLYVLVLDIILLVQDARGNWPFLIVGVGLLICSIILGFRAL